MYLNQMIEVLHKKYIRMMCRPEILVTKEVDVEIVGNFLIKIDLFNKVKN